MLLNVQSNADLDEEARLAVEADAEYNTVSAENTPMLDNLTTIIMDRWDKAKRAKRPIQDQMLKNLRQKNGEYEPEKLAQIKTMQGSTAFILMTDTKCRSGKAWVKDVLFQPGMRPWDVTPTPVPELPDDITQGIADQVMQTALMDLVDQSVMTGVPVDMSMIQQQMTGNADAIKEAILQAVKAKAKENAKKVREKIDDQLVEGKWYQALDKMIDDVIDQKCGFLKGPIFRSTKMRKLSPKLDGGMQVDYEEKPRPFFERRSPFDIYPAPDAVDIDDGYLFDRLSLTRRTLMGLRNLPPESGYKVESINAILEQTRGGKSLNWLQLDYLTDQLTALGQDTAATYDGEKIDCLEFWGSVDGQTLIEWGMDPELIPDSTLDYDICAWMIDRYIIKCMMNYDPMGKKPFFKVSFEEQQDTFWGKCVPELIKDIQGACNAIVRAILNNVGIASGPQIELNKDRLPPGANTQIWPLKVWETTENGLSIAPAMKVYNISMNADKLIPIYNHFSKLADDHCGIPSYESGQAQSGGGAQGTASGLSMLMTAAARGIKAVIRSIDLEVIAPSIEFLFYWDLDNGILDDMICDMNIEAKGSSSLIAREQQSVRINEFLQTTNNPVDLQIIGLEGRKDLLLQATKASEINIKGLEDATVQPIQPAGQPGVPLDQAGNPAGPPGSPGAGLTPGAPLPAPQNVDAAGNASQGQDNRLFKQDQVPQQRT